MEIENNFESEHKKCLKEIEKILHRKEPSYDKVFWIGMTVEAHLSNPKYENEQTEGICLDDD